MNVSARRIDRVITLSGAPEGSPGRKKRENQRKNLREACT
jgi:hypothetical protein